MIVLVPVPVRLNGEATLRLSVPVFEFVKVEMFTAFSFVVVNWPDKFTVPLDKINVDLIIRELLVPIKLEMVKFPLMERLVMVEVKIVVRVVAFGGVPSDPT